MNIGPWLLIGFLVAVVFLVMAWSTHSRESTRFAQDYQALTARDPDADKGRSAPLVVNTADHDTVSVPIQELRDLLASSETAFDKFADTGDGFYCWFGLVVTTRWLRDKLRSQEGV